MRFFFLAIIGVFTHFVLGDNNTNSTLEDSLDIFQKEIQILEETIVLYSKKINALQKMRDIYLKYNKSILVNEFFYFFKNFAMWHLIQLSKRRVF